ncbi:5-formyltetrahydrofolate cyclo-ligase [Butyrivibrio sp. AE3009]|uniref:5-formyltetrahydrofolate cyclo-ligase n=1 Tax=Butyrivibrio sp. AE3009 TaxID=1280666 RepID=UPI0009DBA2AB|nr:5-formyltetrahydrofolate cyclo-ligase [Butyrivibrio sp. AE3009]
MLTLPKCITLRRSFTVKPKKYILFLVYEFIYLLIMKLILGGAGYLQYVGKSILKYNTGSFLLIISTDTYTYNFFAYFAGLLIFLGIVLFNYKFLLSSYEAREVYHKMSYPQAFFALALILLSCPTLAGVLYVVEFLSIAIDSISPEPAALFTIWGWPLIIAILSIIKFNELRNYWKTYSSKSDIRKTVLMQRNALSQDDIADKSEIIFTKLSDTIEYKNAENILIYASTGSEVSTDTIIQNCLDEGKKVFCPKVIDKEKRQMKFIQINSPEELIAGFNGIREPNLSDNSVIYPETEDTSRGTLVIMPGVAFDRYRNRVGYNGGFYDTFLEKHKEISKIAIAFQLQISDTMIATDKHDIKPDLIITEHSKYAV